MALRSTQVLPGLMRVDDWDSAMSGAGTEYFGPNLTYYRVAAGMTMGELARRTKIDPANIGRYERGEIVNVRQVTIQKLCAALGITYAQLVTGPPPELLPPGTPPPRPDRELEPTPDDRLARIEAMVRDIFDRADRATGAIGAGAADPTPRLFPRDARVVRFWGRAAADPSAGETWVEREASADEAVLIAIGDCLAPDIEEDDVLFVRRNRQPQVGEYVVVAVHGELHLKQVWQRTDSTLYLSSKRGELVLPDEGAELLGVIVRITQDKPRREADLSNPGHRESKKPRLVKPLPPAVAGGEDG